jgi:photosystem II stability/assembly factor-like uncharacterized protein
MLRSSAPGALCAAFVFVLAFSTPSSSVATTYDFHWANPKPQGNTVHAIACENPAIGYAVGAQGATLRTTDGGQNWTSLTRYPEFQNPLRAILVRGPGELLAAGGGIFHSQDGGESWDLVEFTSFGIDHLAVIPGSGSVISAVGDFGLVMRSTDGGTTWLNRPSPGIRNLRDQFWVDDTTAYIVGENVARKTTDGGETWLPIPGVPEQSVTYTDVVFADAQNGWILEHFTTYRTTDGGVSWFRRHPNPPQGPIYQEQALVLDPNHRFVITNLEGAEIWETTSDGVSWTRRYQRQHTVGYTDLVRLTDGTMLVASTHGDLLRSTDAGLTWTNFVTSPGDEDRTTLQALAFLPGGKAFASGADGVWLTSTDTGATWDFGLGPGVDTPTTIQFRNDLLGLVGGYGPLGQTKIARTTDGGATWVLHTVSPTYAGYIQGIAFPTDQVAYVVTHGGSGINFVYRSTDGGQTWALRNQGISTGVRLWSVFFVDANTGYVGGGEFSGDVVLWKTTDAGATWNPVPEAGLHQAAITDMHWWDATTGVVVGFSGASRTTNGGQSWGSTLFHSLFRISFGDGVHGYTASYLDRRVLETTDGGVSWAILNLPWEGSPYDVAATPEGFAICGEGSAIIRGSAGGSTSVPGDAGSPPRTRLEQVRVWPNPSRGRSLTFGLESPAAGPVELRIYDAGGRIMEAMTQRVEEGPVALEWERLSGAHSFQAGVYFVEARFPTGARTHGQFVIVPEP